MVMLFSLVELSQVFIRIRKIHMSFGIRRAKLYRLFEEITTLVVVEKILASVVEFMGISTVVVC